jgi:hypothetical protein
MRIGNTTYYSFQLDVGRDMEKLLHDEVFVVPDGRAR